MSKTSSPSLIDPASAPTETKIEPVYRIDKAVEQGTERPALDPTRYGDGASNGRCIDC